jgi:hypothetical protein
MAHSLYAPSSAHRIISCTPSLPLNAELPETNSIYSAEGTAAHHVAELALRTKSRVEKYAGCEVRVDPKGNCQFVHEKSPPINDGDYQFEVTDEMVVALQEYVDWCNELPGDHYAEVKVNISNYTPIPDQYGTCDHAAAVPGALYITDLKYGQGVQVDAAENEQLVLYALGMFDDLDCLYDFQEVHIRVCQPRLDHKDTWVLTREELIEWGDKIRAGFLRAAQDWRDGTGVFNPTVKNCKFCGVAGKCRALQESTAKITALAFDDISGEAACDPSLLTPEELAEAWHHKPLYDIRMAALLEEIARCLANGIDVPGCKVVEAKTHRRWKSEAAAREELEIMGFDEEQIHKTKLISPAQAEALLPKRLRGIVSDLAFKPPGGPCVVDAKDKRIAYDVAVASRFVDAFDIE